MKAKLSVIVDELHGKAGTVVAKRSPVGQIFMKRSIGIDRKEQRQMTARMTIQELGKSWKALTQAQRDEWATAAGTGRSGYELYSELGRNLISVGLRPKPVPYDTVPVGISRLYVEGFNIETNSLYIGFTADSAVIGEKFWVKISKYTPRQLSLDTYKPALIFIGSTQHENRFNIYAEAVKYWGVVPSEPVYFKAEVATVAADSGRRSLVLKGVFYIESGATIYVPDTAFDGRGSYSNPNTSWDTVDFALTWDWLNINPDWQGGYTFYYRLPRKKGTASYGATYSREIESGPDATNSVAFEMDLGGDDVNYVKNDDIMQEVWVVMTNKITGESFESPHWDVPGIAR